MKKDLYCTDGEPCSLNCTGARMCSDKPVRRLTDQIAKLTARIEEQDAQIEELLQWRP
jgi:hypothetical protein